MIYQFEKSKARIIEAAKDGIKQKLPAKQASLCVEFFQQLYGTVALDDLVSHSIEDLSGSALAFWSFIRQRACGETKIRIYNPDYNRDGWQSTHTIVEILHDDMPFLVNSIRMAVDHLDLTIHLVMHMGAMKVQRDKQGQITSILPKETTDTKGVVEEAPIYFEIDKQTDEKTLDELSNNLERVLADIRAAVRDWREMRSKVYEIIDYLDKVEQYLDSDELAESKDFLRWIEGDHFTFFGVRDYQLIHKGGEQFLQIIPESGLGVLTDTSENKIEQNLISMTSEVHKFMASAQILIISKTNTHATIHRPVYTDYIGVKYFNDKGEVIGERRILGLYTSAAYNTNPRHIPFLRKKVATVMKNTHVSSTSHAGKVLVLDIIRICADAINL